MALTGARLRLQQLMRSTIADRENWTYEAVRPMQVPSSWHPGQHVVGDCSKGVQYLCRWADAPDPMQNDWGDYGNSQTIWLKLDHADKASDLSVGDIITFGLYGDDHATMVVVAGANPELWSFGRQGAPESYPLSADNRPRQFCLLPIAKPPPTLKDKLKAKTGYWSWVAWKLGEGPWKTWGPANPSVRPDVPGRIPLAWWKAYAQFLLARKKPNSLQHP